MPPVPFNLKRYPELLPLIGQGTDGSGSLADQAHDSILLRIIRGELADGTELKSTQLAADLEMSRTPVIKALSRLADSGIVEQSLHHRAIVSEGAENWLVDLHRIRQHLEPAAAGASCGRIPRPVFDDLRLICEDSRPSPNRDWQTAARWFDAGLHLAVAEFCGNLPMRQFLRNCWSYKRVSYEAGTDTEAELRSGHRDHEMILQALLDGEANEVRSLMSEHLETSAPKSPDQRIV